MHLVLARLPGAPKGPKGISLFLVPKFLPDADGNPGARNGVICATIEKKMGIKASPTCVLNFEEAKGTIVGKPNQGLAAMFTMMNYARLDVAQHGLSQAERSLQGAAEYTRERLQMRAAKGAVQPDKDADPIIAHADIRRMLLTMKSLTEGCRALTMYASLQLDLKKHKDEAERRRAEDLLAFFTPIAKVSPPRSRARSRTGGSRRSEGTATSARPGVERFVRDSRICQIWEGARTAHPGSGPGRPQAGSAQRTSSPSLLPPRRGLP